MPSVKQGGIEYHFYSLWYDATWDWPMSPGSLANTRPIGPMSRLYIYWSLFNHITLFFSFSLSIFLSLSFTLSLSLSLFLAHHTHPHPHTHKHTHTHTHTHIYIYIYIYIYICTSCSMLISLILLVRIRISSTYLRYIGGFFYAIKNSIFEIGHVEITENRAQERPHRDAICLNVNIFKMVIKWNFSNACSE